MPRKEFDRVIVWFRRDLRVDDNAALLEGCLTANEVIPLFILDEDRLARPDIGPARIAFLIDALQVLDKSLQKLGGRLIIRSGKYPDTIVKAAKEFKAQAIYFHTEYEPFGRKRDSVVVGELAANGVKSKVFSGFCYSDPGEILSLTGKPYTVFTPYKKVWFEIPRSLPVAAPTIVPVPTEVTGESLPALKYLNAETDQKFACGGEDAAKSLLKEFLKKGLSDYPVQRDFMAEDGTSRLSRHLHFGTIAPSTVVHNVRGKTGSDIFLSEIAWRDFYYQILFHFPQVEHGSFRPNLDGIVWENDERLFSAWCTGNTGYPIVDAAMRQMNSEAWMHNRARMIVASFLTKDLLINWQWGERYFMEKLVDGDLAANNGGWQWSAGTGTDSQPYFRIFNPVSQGEKFDPEGMYVRKYVPELRKVPSTAIHSPWKLSRLEQEYFGCVLGKDYPFPVVEHQAQRLRALSIYRAAGDQN